VHLATFGSSRITRVSLCYRRTRAVPHGLKWRCVVAESQDLIPVFVKDIWKGQHGDFAGKGSIGKETTPAMPAPLDLFSTEDHGHHLTHEVVRKRVLTLRPDNAMVKRENGKPVAGWGRQNDRQNNSIPNSRSIILPTTC